MTTQILLAEDQSLVRQGLKMMIETAPDLRVTAEANNGEEALRLLAAKPAITLAILDIRMPVMNGLELAKAIQEHHPHVMTLMLTTFNDDDYAIEALRHGARGYLLKDADPDALIRGIRTCLEGGLALEPHVAANVVPLLMNKPETKPEFPALPEDITERETTVIACVGRGLSNKEISEELYLSVGTVKNLISVILHKLELRDRTQLAIYAIRSGFTER
ncbi:response regulator transcription factor [Salisediminibacterium selenitireducens]|uniref:Two component transcriptional regulator, LuxR family n=1 Tax=Bacillus selenitireducens (strain ATCC 700615 / DSM 15326 / MLS10) TaxID=439292 RepID=D6XWI9_BACIE|nr:response regulator transcription factor [Salisediminibacterium selenitireducens]ADH97831.1 two component transcriptional regulator, LuxR family [[Bacillus] selenitireducens MLS10]